MKKHWCARRGAVAFSQGVVRGSITTSQVGSRASTYSRTANRSPAPIEIAPEASGRCGLLRRSISRSWTWLMTLLAAFSRAAVTEPSPIIKRTDGEKWRPGSGLCADPKAVSAPETTPNVGGRSVNGRVKVKYSLALEAKPVIGVGAVSSIVASYDTHPVSVCGNSGFLTNCLRKRSAAPFQQTEVSVLHQGAQTRVHLDHRCGVDLPADPSAAGTTR